MRGPQVFVGYLGAPEETEKVFYDGWLRTGDLGRWDDGFLVMADRQKEMIIQGGFNVYPSQVENAIKSMPGVRDVAVVGMPDENRGESVVAVLVLEPGAAVDLDAVRRWTQDKLSHYAMPKSIAVRDNLPRSQIGKVMRRVVKEELAQSFELHGGQWKKIQSAAEERAEALSAAVSASVTGLSTHVAEQLAATKEQLTEKFAQAGSAKKHASSTQPAGAPAQSAETPDGAPEASASESPSAPSAA